MACTFLFASNQKLSIALLFLLISQIFLILSGCKNMGGNLDQVNNESTKLKGIMDQEHVLKLKRLSRQDSFGFDGWYRFEMCTLDYTVNRRGKKTYKEGDFCTGAFRDKLGDDIVFGIEHIQEKELTAEQKKAWQEMRFSYRNWIKKNRDAEIAHGFSGAALVISTGIAIASVTVVPPLGIALFSTSTVAGLVGIGSAAKIVSTVNKSAAEDDFHEKSDLADDKWGDNLN
ncbi:MAG: hypothetical protein OXC40_01410, partial [Proteobacteria bacterium]|nr:hypothetical protein [Pseudomonadota bacterium]